jgi:hypothetical protein
MKVVRDVLSVGLLASGLLGVEILTNDRWLWSAAPSHAYGLIAFVAIDLVVALTLFIRISVATVGAGLIATAQLGAMLVDTTIGQPQGVAMNAFAAYLLSDPSYIGLLVMQAGILLIVMVTLAMSLFHKHRRSMFFAHTQPR